MMAIASTIITGLTAKNSFPKNYGTKTGAIAINPAIIGNANANDIWKLGYVRIIGVNSK